MAAISGRSATLQILLGAGAAVDAQDHRSQTALHLAAMNGHADSVQLLISRRMIRAGGWNYCSAAICLVPNVQIIPNSAEQTKDEQGLSADTKQAAENLDDVITDLVKKFAEVTAPLFSRWVLHRFQLFGASSCVVSLGNDFLRTAGQGAPVVLR